MRYLRLQTLGFAALLATLTAIHCLPTEAQADRRRRPWTTYVSASDRLVVECDMRSDTCSDGRRIATTRSTPVPCEVSPGVWEMVPEDTACISYRGLESWAATTSYLSYGAELDRSPWSSGGAAGHEVRVYDVEGVNRMCQEAPLSPTSPAGRYQIAPIPTEAGTNTLSCIARPNTGSSIRLNAGDSSQAVTFPMEPGWARYTHSTEVEEGQGAAISVYTRGQTCIDIVGCWLTRTDTPGRACWGGEAPVTCAADRHTISTEGWPTESGEISMVVELNEQLAAGRNAWLFDGRDAGDLMGVNPYIQPDGRLRFRVAGTVYGSASPMLTWEVGRPYALRFLRKGGRTDIYRDGALVYSVATPDWAWVPSAHLGMNFSFTGPEAALTIRSLTVRSYEEGSP